MGTSADRIDLAESVLATAGAKQWMGMRISGDIFTTFAVMLEDGPWPISRPWWCAASQAAVAAQFSFFVIGLGGFGDPGYNADARAIIDTISVRSSEPGGILIWDVLTGNQRSGSAGLRVRSIDMGDVPEQQINSGQAFAVPAIGSMTAGSGAQAGDLIQNSTTMLVNTYAQGGGAPKRLGLILVPGCQFWIRPATVNQTLDVELRGRYFQS